MPLFIFFGARPDYGTLTITPLSPYDFEGAAARDADLIFGIHIAGGSALNINFNSLNLSWKGGSVINSGVAVDGYSYSKHIGYFDDHIGWVVRVVNTATSYTPSSATRLSNPNTNISATAYAEDNGNHISATQAWQYTTGSNMAHYSLGHFGSYPGGRFALLTTNIDDSQLVADGLILHTAQLYSQNFAFEALIRSSQGMIFHTEQLYSLDFDFESLIQSGSSVTRQEYTQSQIVGQPSPMPTFMGPLFGAKVIKNQEEGLKIQP